MYSPLEAVTLARENPDRQVVFFAVGFETTAPANALSVLHAQRAGLTNYAILASHVLVPPAMRAVLDDEHNLIQGVLGRRTRLRYHGYRRVLSDRGRLSASGGDYRVSSR